MRCERRVVVAPRSAARSPAWCSRRAPARNRRRIRRAGRRCVMTSLRPAKARGAAASFAISAVRLAFGELPVQLGRRDRVGQRVEHRARVLRAATAISSSRAPAYRPSSKPYQRSLKNMCPLISPASGAPVSFSFALISEWPVFHSSGLPPWLADPRREIARALHVEDDLGARLPREHVGGEQHQLPVGVDDVAVLGDHAEPVAVAVERQAELGVRRARASGSGPAGSRAARDRDGGSGTCRRRRRRARSPSQPSRR